MSPVRLSVPTKWVRLVCLVAFFAFALSTLPVHIKHNIANAQSSGRRRTQGPLDWNLPGLDTADVTLTTGAYEFNLEYFESSGPSVTLLS